MKGPEAMAASGNGRRHLLSLLPVLCIWGMILLAHPGPASAQPGFVTVDCGAVSGYVDTTTGIAYEADNYIGTGNMTSTPRTVDQLYLNTLRYFPVATTPRKNCYQIPVVANAQYLVRAFFFHGGYTVPPANNFRWLWIPQSGRIWKSTVRRIPTPWKRSL